jgi:peptidoglycan/LPS O-acetylase OafA/YrhL
MRSWCKRSLDVEKKHEQQVQWGRLVIDLMKALAAQIILWHHFCRYGPMANTLHEQGQAWVGWLAQHGRLAVQVFLVVSGFLAMQRVKAWLEGGAQGRALLVQTTRRCRRIAVPYWWMIVAALGAAWLARAVIADPDTPAAPSLTQVLAHVLFVQDIFGQPAVSTGVWYVAIDLQLHLGFTALVLAIGWVMRSNVHLPGTRDTWTLHCLAGVLWLGLVAAMFMFNRDPRFDMWATYFIGSFCLGGLMAWSAGLDAALRKLSRLALLLVCAGALAVHWRVEVLAAIGAALMLVWSQATLDSKGVWSRLNRESYCLFLFHYPVILVVGSIVEASYPGQAIAAGLGMIGAWCLAMILAGWINGQLEPRQLGPRQFGRISRHRAWSLGRQDSACDGCKVSAVVVGTFDYDNRHSFRRDSDHAQHFPIKQLRLGTDHRDEDALNFEAGTGTKTRPQACHHRTLELALAIA